ncbi:type I-F CRISPR-associated protein Csy2 [uncultured Dialister sp.]|uniref:type I-F CRISPR-associated protein Csy2 n=1 Tax=uncultured Dialister sp. TaxID=278064 RepID=UPI00261D2F29|nr:type I-F CRISPR-associated protein Csy2 [uncultured Dialister sp.]
MKSYLLIRHMKVHNANAMSSTLTIGVPAVTAWMGAVHALERKIRQQKTWNHIRFPRAGISFHQCNLQVYKGIGDSYYSIIGTANPLRKKGAGFERPPFIEEPRIHLDISLLVEVEGLDGDNDEEFLACVRQLLPSMKIAGGDILEIRKSRLCYADRDHPQEERKVLSALMPGFVLIERDDLIRQMTETGTDSLQALLDYLKITRTARKDENGNIDGWDYFRKGNGWLVPISVGFKGISKLGKVKNQRDTSVPHQFVENAVTLGEFRMPYRFEHVDDILWHYEYDSKNSLYLCSNHK